MVFEQWARAQPLEASNALLGISHVCLSSQCPFLIWSTAVTAEEARALFRQAFEKVFLIILFLEHSELDEDRIQ